MIPPPPRKEIGLRASPLVPWVGLVLLLAFACADGPSRDSEAERRETRSTMAQILGALRVALPLSLSDERFSDPANRQALHQALETLAANAAALQTHGNAEEAGFRYLSRSLAEDSRSIARRFDEGRHREARFLLGQLTEDCVACHSRLPSPEASALGRILLEEVDVEGLEPEERVRLEVATRQFDAAIAGYERLFAAEATTPVRADLEGLLTDYLVLVIRVKDDLPRARRTLEAFAARGDLPRYLERNVGAWIGELAELERSPATGPAVERAGALLDEARRRSGFPADRTLLIYDLVASGILHRHVTEHREPSAQLAEAYYLLGVAEARIRRSSWLFESEFYLETAIRMAPDAPFAELAYAQLEEETLAGYSGSSGLHLPADVQANLEELRALVEQP